MTEKQNIFTPKFAANLFFLFCALVLIFLGLYRNQWNVVREKKFKSFQTDSESLVMARLVETRQNGIFSYNGLLGWGDANPLNLKSNDYQHQYDIYLTDQNFQNYSLYKSISGFQAMFWGALDRLSPWSPAVNLRNFRALEALLFGLTLTLFLSWILYEFGWLPAVAVLLTTLVSQWITLYGRNLFYFLWATFLPLGLIAFYLAWEEKKGTASNLRLAMLAFAGMLFKCMMNGYDYIIPALAMPTVPLIYYALRSRWDRSKLAKRFLIMAASLLVAVLVSLLILAAQLSVSEGSFWGGLVSILDTFGRRTYGQANLYPGNEAGLEANTWSVLWTYISQDTAINVLGLNFLGVIIIFAAFTVIYLAFDKLRKGSIPDRKKTYALIGATWFSILSPISWFTIFKGQAYYHTHTNYVAWHMPFTLFGYAMCGLILQSIVSTLWVRRAQAVDPPTA